jgi:hypothetical protein
VSDLWPDVAAIIAANRDAAARARAEGDRRRAQTHEAAAARLEAGR